MIDPIRLRSLTILVAIAAALACSTETVSPVVHGTGAGGAPDGGASGGSGGGGGSAVGVPCGASGISKGPWVLAMKDTSVLLRWEACRPGTPAGVTVIPEAGGDAVSLPSTESAFEVKTTHEAVLAPDDVPPDVAGTYYMHDAELTRLAPGTCYTYSLVADEARAGRFCTSKPPGAPIRFLAIGDTDPGLGDHTSKLLTHVLPDHPDFSIHAGDLEYYTSGLDTWALWSDLMHPLLAEGAFLPCVGNHEIIEVENELEEYYVRFFGGGGYGGSPYYYRYSSGGVWFFSLDTEMALDPASEQWTWFTAGLAEAAASPGYRFSVLYLHRPIVTCGDNGSNDALRAALEPLMATYHVPLVVQGHMHGYERFEINGVTYVTSAGGGALLGNVDENIDLPICAMRVASGAFFHAEIFDVTTGTLSGKAVDSDGQVRDSFTKSVP